MLRAILSDAWAADRLLIVIVMKVMRLIEEAVQSVEKVQEQARDYSRDELPQDSANIAQVERPKSAKISAFLQHSHGTVHSLPAANLGQKEALARERSFRRALRLRLWHIANWSQSYRTELCFHSTPLR